jgi:hypothetical protein
MTFLRKSLKFVDLGVFVMGTRTANNRNFCPIIENLGFFCFLPVTYGTGTVT